MHWSHIAVWPKLDKLHWHTCHKGVDGRPRNTLESVPHENMEDITFSHGETTGILGSPEDNIYEHPNVPDGNLDILPDHTYLDGGRIGTDPGSFYCAEKAAHIFCNEANPTHKGNPHEPPHRGGGKRNLAGW